MDVARLGNGLRLGFFRLGVYRDDWDILLKRFEGIASCDVTRRKLSLGDADAVTGVYEKTWSEYTVKSLFVTRGANKTALSMGTFVRLDAVMRTADPVDEGDEVQHANGDYYEVETVKPEYLGDSFWFRECDLTRLPMHDLTYLDTSPSVNDARYNTKVYWNTYIEGANLNNHNHLVCYSGADYPITRVFKDKNIHIVFTVDSPSSTPLIGHDRAPYGYEEHVPTHVLTLNTELNHLAEAELRRVAETYPSGSQRSLERRSSTVHNFGGTNVYDTEFVLKYRRDTT